MNRRNFVRLAGPGVMFLPLVNKITFSDSVPLLSISTEPLFNLSPWIYMQFMEPLGISDSSVEAAWDHGTEDWRDNVIQLTKELAPGMIRWGGVFSSYYRWKEGVGPRKNRRPMLNIQWGGMETNQIGTVEFVDFCRRVGADPLLCVNFESDGNPGWAVNRKGEIRAADATEAAQWVDYCNNPGNRLRRRHGFHDPLAVKIWQIGNETSYHNGFDVVSAARKTVEFAKAMKNVDSSIKIIGWGDSGWARQMMDIAGEYIDYIAFHHGFHPVESRDNLSEMQRINESPLNFNYYRKDPASTWNHLIYDGYRIHEKRLGEMREEIHGSQMPLAMTECHFGLKGRNRGEVLSTWAAGVSYARLMNLHERNGDVLKIATLADFCGTRWMTNAMIIVPGNNPVLMPVGKIMSLYRRHTGEQLLRTEGGHKDLDITASITGKTIYLHVVNTSRTDASSIRVEVPGWTVTSSRSFVLCTDPEYEVLGSPFDPLKPVERVLPVDEPMLFPAASVTAVELVIS